MKRGRRPQQTKTRHTPLPAHPVREPDPATSDTNTPLATHHYVPGRPEAALELPKRTRAEPPQIRMVDVGRSYVHVIDVNKDYFEVRGVGYPDADVVPLLRAVNTAFNPDTVHDAIEDEYKEYGAGRRYTWAHDRVM